MPRGSLLLVLAILLAPAVEGAQGATARLGLIGPDEEPRFSEIASGLRQGLHELGYAREGIHIVEGRVRRGDEAGARAAARALVAERVAVLFAVGSALARHAREAAAELPIVFVTPGDPVATGLVASFARPGGNMTAMTLEYPELSGKRLELLREVAPRVRRVLALYDPRDASPRQSVAAARAAAAKLGLSLVERAVETPDEIARGLAELDAADGLLGIPGGATSGQYGRMILAANARRRPSVFPTQTEGTRDALLSYGARDTEVARQAARLVDKILRGARAGDIPVERPTRLILVVNARTARALGLTVPRTLLLRADQVVE